MTAPSRDAADSSAADVPPGVIKVVPIGDDWYSVRIGRAARTKRFNLSRGEAAELVRVLAAEVLTLDQAPPSTGGEQ